MGTRGFRVYRHKGYYHVHYNHYDSYPSNLGLKVAAEVPHDEEQYKKWLESLREALDHHFENNKDQIDSNDGGYRITTERPMNDIMIEWVYEIDLDHEVFLIDSNPMFALNNMPDSDDLFLTCIGFDAYRHRACDPSTPEKHRYNWKSAPPNVDDSVIDDYATRQPGPDIQLSISELLGTADLTNTCEAVRNALYEVIISRMMQTWEIGHSIRVLETATDRADISGDLLSMGVDMVQVAFGRMLFEPQVERERAATREEILRSFSGIKEKKPVSIPPEFSWLASDVCLRITTHLDDARNLKKSILELVDEITRTRQPGRVTYGILFSFFHCVIVRVDPQNGFTATPALQFLPSFFATSPSTPGIAAIGSLAYHCLDTLNLSGASTSTTSNTLHPNHFLHQVPLDVLEVIAGHLAPSDLKSLCTAVPLLLLDRAAQSVLRFPHIEAYRLVQAAPAMTEDEVVVQDDGEMEFRKGGPSLLRKTFSTVVRGAAGPVLVVGGDEGYQEHSFYISLGGDGEKVGWKVLPSSGEMN